MEFSVTMNITLVNSPIKNGKISQSHINMIHQKLIDYSLVRRDQRKSKRDQQKILQKEREETLSNLK